ncbi:MAG: hypothetical protein Q4G09_01940 [Clostridia bacterium]|nr:hypothetical protein [Clostridia bacterium]
MKKLANQKGAITVLTLVSILFMVSFLISSYMIIANKVKTQKETTMQIKAIYEDTPSMQEAYGSFFEGNTVPIYDKDQLFAIGSGENMIINGKYYTFSNNKETMYKLMNDISFDADDIEDDYWEPINDNQDLNISFNGNKHNIQVNYDDLVSGEYSMVYSEENNFSESIGVSIGDFVKYNIEYTDIYYSDYEYTNKNGWRLLRYQTTDGGETITNVEIISTGIPARLKYSTNATNNAWWDTSGITTFRTALKNYWNGTTAYPLYNNSTTSANVKASAGMYNKCESISFLKDTTPADNQGEYTNITKAGTAMSGTKTGGVLFKTGYANKVRMLTLSEMNKAVGASAINLWQYTIGQNNTSIRDPAPGLFRIGQLCMIAEFDTYEYSNTGYYWLASPCSDNANFIHNVSYSGYVNGNYGVTRGVRPVISLRFYSI